MSEKEKTQVIAKAFNAMDDYTKGYMLGMAENELRHQQKREKPEEDGKEKT